MSLTEPAHSFCPKCKNTLSAADLVPLFSYLALGRKCRQCKAPISPRYLGVELLTGLVFVALTLRFLPNVPDCLTLLLFASVLIPVFFIDLDTFTIPISLTLLLFLIPVARDIWGIVQHEPNHALTAGWLPTSLLGALVGALIFGVVRVAGWLWKRQEAMGLGDVLLGRGMGAMLIGLVPADANPLRLFPVWVMLSVSSGAIIGVAMQLLSGKSNENNAEAVPASETQIPAQDGSNIGREIMDIGWCLWLGDAWEYLADVFQRGKAPQGQNESPQSPENNTEDEWKPAPSAIPFGPFMVAGFLATVFIGDWLTNLYLHWAFPPALHP